MAKETKVNRTGTFQPQPHPRLSKLRERTTNQSTTQATSNSYKVTLKHFQSPCLADSLPDLLETSSSLSTSTSPSTASSGCASFSSSTSTSSSSSSASSSSSSSSSSFSSNNRSHVLSEPISSFLGSSKQQQQHLHIYEDIDVRGPIRMTPVSGVMLEEKKGLIKPQPFKVTPRPGMSSNSCSISNNFIAPNSNPSINNLNVQQVHEGTVKETSPLMCDRMAISDLQHKLSDRISCLSPLHSTIDDSSVNRTLDLSSRVINKCPSKGANSLLTTTNDFGSLVQSHKLQEITRQHNQLASLETTGMHHSPLTFVMTSASSSSSSGIGDSSSSSGHSFTTNSQCSLSQSSYQLDDDATWYSASTFDTHQPVIHSTRGLVNNIHGTVREEKPRHNNNTGITSNNLNNGNNDNPTLPPRQRVNLFNIPKQRVNSVERSSTFNSDDLTMQSTPSPCSDNDTIHGIKLNELQSLVREKDAQISYLRETLEQNEQVIFKVYEEKEQSWHKEYKKLRTQFESSLMLYQQKALKAESNLAFASKQAEDEKNCLLAEMAAYKEKNSLLERKLAEVNRRVQPKPSARVGPLTGMKDDKQSSTDDTNTGNLQQLDLQQCEQMTNIQLLQKQVAQLVDDIKSSESQVNELSTENTDLKLLQAKLTTQLDLIQQSFNAERSVWQDEKDKVIQYQKQLNRNFLLILQRNKELELQIQSLKQSSNMNNMSNTIFQITTGETTC